MNTGLSVAVRPGSSSCTAPRLLGTPALDEAAADIRMHTRVRDVVVVRVDGHLGPAGAHLLRVRVEYHLARAGHVIVELVGERLLDAATTAVVLALREVADRHGSVLHLAAEHDAVRRTLADAGFDQPLRACADQVLAGLPGGIRSTSAMPPRLAPQPASRTGHGA